MSQRFAERIHTALELRAWSPADLARAVRVTRAAVSHWCSGRSEPSGELLTAIAEVLRVSPHWLARGVGAIDASSADMRATPAPPPRDNIGAGFDEVLDGIAMDLRREAAELVRAWLALPEVERDRHKRAIETDALRYRRHTPDQRTAKHRVATKVSARRQ